jgi:phosphoglucosamine mutase
MAAKAKKRYFGTDGIRGRVGSEGMSPEMAMKLGWAAGMVLKQISNAPVIIGKDTRISGYLFESALEAGFAAAGVDVRLLGPMPTPAIAYIAKTFGAVSGVVISASHNPYYDNGIKFFNSEGRKLGDDLEQAIEAMMDEPMICVPSQLLGKVSRINDAAGRYIEFCKSTMEHGYRLNGLKIVVDCANGATYQVAPHVFTELGAEVIVIGNTPNGLNINDGVGATDPAALQRSVLREKADLGIALDGDGDRLILVDHTGAVLDGDDILFIIMSGQDTPVKGVVGTVMSNMGLENYCRKQGIDFHRTPVGDRYVMEKLMAEGLNYGAEPSGHILCLDKIPTGDGIVSALQVLSVLVKRKVGLNALKQGFIRYPQELVNVRLAKKIKALDDARIVAAISDAEAQLGKDGRLLIRLSGTEPLIRIMVEGRDAVQVKQIVLQLEALVIEVYGG